MELKLSANQDIIKGDIVTISPSSEHFGRGHTNPCHERGLVISDTAYITHGRHDYYVYEVIWMNEETNCYKIDDLLKLDVSEENEEIRFKRMMHGL